MTLNLTRSKFYIILQHIEQRYTHSLPKLIIHNATAGAMAAKHLKAAA